MPLFQQFAINNFIKMDTTEEFGFLAWSMVCHHFADDFVVLFTRRSMKVEMRLGRDMKRACFVHLQQLSLSYYNVTPVGYILARVMSDTNRIAGLVAWGLVDMLWSFTYVVGVFIAMFLINPGLALLVILIVPAIALLTAYFQKRILHWNRKVRRINSQITGLYNEGIMGAKNL